jgi:hypothetical protein
VLRFTNPVSGSRDGAVFLWLGEAGRPVVAAQLYWNARRVWIEKFSWLCTSPLVAKSTDGREWRTARAGVSFEPLANAPRPAATAAQRLRQMRQLADRVGAEHFYWKDKKVWSLPARNGGTAWDPHRTFYARR